MIRLSGLRPRSLLVVLVIGLTAAACGTGSDGPPTSPVDNHPLTMAGTTWLVSSIGGLPITIGNGPTIAFGEAQVQGSGGCNHLGGGYRYDSRTGQLQFDQLGMTAMACAEPERNAVESSFILALGQPSLVVTMAPDGHVLLDSGGSQIDLAPTSSTNGG